MTTSNICTWTKTQDQDELKINELTFANRNSEKNAEQLQEPGQTEPNCSS
jgi:hypothetical protein